MERKTEHVTSVLKSLNMLHLRKPKPFHVNQNVKIMSITDNIAVWGMTKEDHDKALDKCLYILYQNILTANSNLDWMKFLISDLKSRGKELQA